MVTIADFHESLLTAEEEIKFAELSIDCLASIEDENCVAACSPRGVVIPAINELRYATKHLSCAIQEDSTEGCRIEQLRRGISHCIRARLDALRAVALFLARDFYQFSADYRKLKIPAKDRDKLNAYRQKIWDVLSTLSRDRSQSTNENCEKLKMSIAELHDIYIDISNYRGVFNELMAKMNWMSKLTTRQWIIGIVYTAVVSAVSYFCGTLR